VSIIDIREAKEMRECFKKIDGRKGVSKRALAICKSVAKSNSLRDAVFAIGRMSRLMQVCKYDGYWNEKSSIGKTMEYYAVKQAAKNEGDFSKAEDAFPIGD